MRRCNCMYVYVYVCMWLPLCVCVSIRLRIWCKPFSTCIECTMSRAHPYRTLCDIFGLRRETDPSDRAWPRLVTLATIWPQLEAQIHHHFRHYCHFRYNVICCWCCYCYCCSSCGCWDGSTCLLLATTNLAATVRHIQPWNVSLLYLVCWSASFLQSVLVCTLGLRWEDAPCRDETMLGLRPWTGRVRPVVAATDYYTMRSIRKVRSLVPLRSVWCQFLLRNEVHFHHRYPIRSLCSKTLLHGLSKRLHQIVYRESNK